MTVKFNVVPRGNPSNPALPKKFYPSIQSSGRTTMRQLATRIAERDEIVKEQSHA